MILGTSRGWIGIDVGTRAVKLAQVSRRGSRMFLEDAVVLPRVPALPLGALALDLSSQGELQAARALGRRFVGNIAAATMPHPSCQLHPLHISGSGEPGHRAVISELQRITQETGSDFSSESWQVDCWRLDQAGGNGPDMPNVCALTVPRTSSDKLSRDIQRAGMQCALLDGEPLALARAAQLCCADEQPVAAIDWGYSHTLLTVAVKGCPVYTRSLPDCSFSVIVNAIGRSHGLLPNEAECLLSSVGLPVNNLCRAAGGLWNRAAVATPRWLGDFCAWRRILCQCLSRRWNGRYLSSNRTDARGVLR